uniref:Ig-like domain-containing protein n=1 Tax=Labrus bergylta TaxID=56723 RepID=A0A3Q3ENL4_9LABR
MEADQKQTVMAGCPIALQCELSDPTGQVSWYKDGTQLLLQSGVDIQSEGSVRSLVVPSAERAHTGIYRCESKDDDIQFAVEVKGDSLKLCRAFTALHCQLTITVVNSSLIQNPCCSSLLGRSPKIMPVSLSEKNKLITVGCPIILQCEVSDPASQVSWFKDEVELFCKTGLDMKRGGSVRKLMIHSAKVSDAGLYSCSLADDVVTFHVDVEGDLLVLSILLCLQVSDEHLRILFITLICTLIYPNISLDTCQYSENLVIPTATPVKFSTLPEIARKKFFEAGCPVKLQCEVSEPTAQVYWHKDGEQLPPESEYETQTKDKLRALIIQSAEVRHSGAYSCEAADDRIEFKVDVDLFKSVVEQEELVLSCEVSRADGVVQWYKDGIEMQQSNKITIKAEGTQWNLTIHQAQLSDTGTYSCRAGDNVLLFKVNVREPPVMITYPKEDVHLDRHVPEEIILSCELSRQNGAVSWYKDGQKLQESENIKLKVEGPYRRLKIISSGVEDSGEYVCDTADDSIFFHLTITVRIVSPSQSQMELCQQTSERMVLSCEISRPNAVVRWYRDGLEVEENDNLILEVDGVYRRLIIPETTVKDSAEYVCDTADDSMTFFVNIAEPPVRFVRPRKMASRVEMVAGETLVLDCEVSRSNAEVSWKRNGEEVEDSRNITILEDGVIRQLTIHSLVLEDTGQYVCDAKDDVMDFQVKVQELPVKIVGKTDAKTENRERANVRWLKDGQLLNQDNIHISSEGITHKLTINPLQLSDSGEYVCDVNTDEIYYLWNYMIFVYTSEMPVKFIRPLENIVSLKGNSLILRCEINKPKGDVQWLKDGQEIPPSRRHTIRAQARERSFTIHQLQDEDAGEYACESTDDRTSATVTVETPCLVEFIAELRNTTVREGEDAVFKCVVSPEDTRLVWRLNGKQVAVNERTPISSNGLCHMLCIHNCRVSDSARVTADASGLVSEAELQVQEQQVLFTKKMAPLVAEEYSEATLEVEVSVDSGEVQWMRQGVLIHPGAKYTLKHKGQLHSLHIHTLAMSDRGTYSCETLHDRTQAQLTVEPRKITMKRGLTDIKTTERETASFEVELSHPNVPGTWTRNGIKLKPTNHFRMSAKGPVHSLTISNLSVEDTGSFMFCVENLKTTARLVVKELPVNIVKPLQDKTALEKTRVLLDCAVSNPRCSIRWYKGSNVILPSERFEICSEGCYRKLIIQEVAQHDEGTYSVQVGEHTCSAKLTVEARSLQMVRELKDVEVMAPNEACFECEVSVPVLKAPVWSLNGEPLQDSSQVSLEKMGTVHRLTLRQTSPDMSGEVEFTYGKANSRAQLRVLRCLHVRTVHICEASDDRRHSSNLNW